MSEDFDKYLAIANHDIQTANNISELKCYVASILYDNDKKVELLQQKDNIIKEVREYIEKNTEEKKSWLNGIPDYTVFKGNIEQVLEILDKEN